MAKNCVVWANGLIMQWGMSVKVTGVYDSYPIIYHLTFEKYAFPIAVVTSDDSRDNGAGELSLHSKSLEGFTARMEDMGSSAMKGIIWFAIGN